MGDFSQLSRFNPDANFKLVRIGADCPVLEVELNEMQDISEARYKHLIKSYFGNVIQGDGNYVYDNGTLTITDENAFVEGNVVEITKLKCEIAEGEKLYLKVWEDTIRYSDVIKYKGNQQEERTIPNTLLDERVGTETSRRIQVKYDLAKSTTEEDNVTYLYIGKVFNNEFIVESEVLTKKPKVTVERLISKGSQQIFTFKGVYKMGINCLNVYVNGIHQIPQANYTELSNNSIQFVEPIEKDAEVVVVYQRTAQSKTRIEEGHSTEHTVDGDDPIDILDLADRTNLIPRIEKRLAINTIDCGSFNDMSTDSETIIDGGVF